MGRRLVTLALLASSVAVVYVSASCASPAAASPGAVPTSTGPRELDANQQIAQALSRLTFGARPGDADRVKAMGVDRWVDAQLHPERLSDSATDAFLAHYQTLSLSSAAIYEQFPPAALLRAVARRDSMQRSGRPTLADSLQLLQQARRSNQFVAELTSSRVARAVMSERQLEEVMVTRPRYSSP